MDILKSAPAPAASITFKNNNLYIRNNGLAIDGVFSNRKLKKGETIECCPVIVFSQKDVEFLKYTNLYNYYALKGKGGVPDVLPLGFGSVYNHSSPSNAEYKLDLIKKTLTIISVCSIDADVEITINYNGEFDDDSPVAFAAKDKIYEFSVTLF
jgi:hypothetical protein